MPTFAGMGAKMAVRRAEAGTEFQISGGTGSAAPELPPEKPGGVAIGDTGTGSTEVRNSTSVSDSEWSRILMARGMSGIGEPQEYDNTLIGSRRFQLCVGALVMCNALFIGLDTDINYKVVTSATPSPAVQVLVIVDNIFCTVWILEMCIRLRYQGLLYFMDGYNILDFFLVWLGVFTTWIASRILHEDTLTNSVGGMSLGSILNVLRILKLLRLIKLLRMFKKAYYIVRGFVTALRTLGWVVLLLFGVIYTGSIFMTVVVGHTCTTDYVDWPACSEHFGNVWVSMFTLFQVMTFESWSTAIARPVLHHKGWLVMFFLFFLGVTSFGLLNIIVGVVVEHTLESSNEERRNELEKQEMIKRMQLNELRGIFEEADEDGSGNVDQEEFVQIMIRRDVRRKLRELDVPTDFPDKLFEYIDQDESGEITIDEFIDGAMMLKQEPSASDMRTMVMQVSLIVNKVTKMETLMLSMAEELGLADREGAASPAESVKKKKSRKRHRPKAASVEQRHEHSVLARIDSESILDQAHTAEEGNASCDRLHVSDREIHLGKPAQPRGDNMDVPSAWLNPMPVEAPPQLFDEAALSRETSSVDNGGDEYVPPDWSWSRQNSPLHAASVRSDDARYRRLRPATLAPVAHMENHGSRLDILEDGMRQCLQKITSLQEVLVPGELQTGPRPTIFNSEATSLDCGGTYCIETV